MRLPPFDEDMKQCINITIIDDKIIEGEESLSMSVLSVEYHKHPSLSHLVDHDFRFYEIRIQDASKLFNRSVSCMTFITNF